ncbi:MAG: cyanophycin synthetase [Verrucomicrobia bacterium]|nr:MAG: cyanophycin synthetase [Verrucomicrobiota bacterium]
MPDLDIRKIHILRGPNLWTNQPVLEAWIAIGSIKEATTKQSPGFTARLKAWLPGMTKHGAGEGKPGEFFTRPNKAAAPAHLLERVASELQTLVEHPTNFSSTQPPDANGLYKVIVSYHDEEVAQACLHSARALLLAAYRGEAFDLAAELELLRDVVDCHALGPSTKAIVDAAKLRGIPWRRLQPGRSLIQLGHGTKQRRIWTAETDSTGAIAEHIAKDKNLTRATLRRVGVPVPNGRIVTDAEDAWEAAQDLGLPVVIKPLDANHGRGVFLDMRTREQIAEVFPHAAACGTAVIAEHFIPGVDHRLLVVGSRMVAASRGEPAIVIGDAIQSIHQLIESQLNSDPRRSFHDTAPWAKIETSDWDPTLLADLQMQGFAVTSVPHQGQRVIVSRFANPSVDVTDEVHPSVSEHAVIAAQTAGLDICGVDVVCGDISRPLEEQGGAVVEINASPGLHIHLEPAVGMARPVGQAIIDMLFPADDDGRIPLLAVTGTRGKTTTIRLLAHFLRASGKFLAVSSSDGLHFGTRHTSHTSGEGVPAVLLHPWTEIAICEASEQNILSGGLGFDSCQLGVVLNVSSAGSDPATATSLEHLARAQRCVVNTIQPRGTAILNADDEWVVLMAEHCKGSVIFFTREPTRAAVMTHRALGGRAVLVRDGCIQLADGRTERQLCSLGQIAMPTAGHRDGRLENLLAAVAAAWAYGLSEVFLSSGLQDLAGLL